MWSFFAKVRNWITDYEPYLPAKDVSALDHNNDDFDDLILQSSDSFHPISNWSYSVLKNKKTNKYHTHQRCIKTTPENRQSLARLKTLRHPGLAMPVSIYGRHAFEHQTGSRLHELWYGIRNITEALLFLHTEAKLIHCRVCAESVFVSLYPRYGWKLCELDSVRSIDDTQSLSLHPYPPPDSNVSPAMDSWGLGCLIWQLFNVKQQNADFSQCEMIKPNELCNRLYKKLMIRTMDRRLKIKDAFDIVDEFVSQTPFARVLNFLNSQIYTVADNNERQRLLTGTARFFDDLHDQALRYGVVPALASLLRTDSFDQTSFSYIFELSTVFCV
ncbi:hypothetical protein ACOME3_000473 [Neoechinorhynchus agilis]